MNDFLQSFSFGPSRPPSARRPAVPDWVQRGLMRSFGEDNLPAYRPSPVGRSNQKSKIKNRK